MKKTLALMGTVTVMAAAMAFAASAETVVKYSVTYPATGTQAEGALALGELIEECSEGRL